MLKTPEAQSTENGLIHTTINHTPPQKPLIECWNWAVGMRRTRVVSMGGLSEVGWDCICLLVERGVCGCMPQTDWKRCQKSTNSCRLCVRCVRIQGRLRRVSFNDTAASVQNSVSSQKPTRSAVSAEESTAAVIWGLQLQSPSMIILLCNECLELNMFCHFVSPCSQGCKPAARWMLPWLNQKQTLL